VVHLDFLAVLQAQLADRGLDYVVAASNLNLPPRRARASA
jgi:hypothetical protein